MTQDEYEVGSLEDAEKFAIIRMARDGIQSYLSNGGLFNPEEMNHDKVRELIMLCRDALDLVAAHSVADYKMLQEIEYVGNLYPDGLTNQIEAAVLAEREACAKVADEAHRDTGWCCAAAIRARGENK